RWLMRTMVDFAVMYFQPSGREFPPSAAEIKRSHAVYQERIVFAPNRPNKRPPTAAQQFNRSEAVSFHVRFATRSQLPGLAAFWITAICDNVNKSGPHSPVKAA